VNRTLRTCCDVTTSQQTYRYFTRVTSNRLVRQRVKTLLCKNQLIGSKALTVKRRTEITRQAVKALTIRRRTEMTQEAIKGLTVR